MDNNQIEELPPGVFNYNTELTILWVTHVYVHIRYYWLERRILPTAEEFKTQQFERKFELDRYRKIDNFQLPRTPYPYGLLNISVPHRPTKPSQKLVTWTFKATTNLAADKTVINTMWPVSSSRKRSWNEWDWYAWTLPLARTKGVMVLLRVTLMLKIVNLEWLSKWIACPKHFTDNYRKMLNFSRPDGKCTTKIHEGIKMFNSNPGYILDLQTRYDPIEDLPPEVFQNTDYQLLFIIVWTVASIWPKEILQYLSTLFKDKYPGILFNLVKQSYSVQCNWNVFKVRITKPLQPFYCRKRRFICATFRYEFDEWDKFPLT